MESVSIAVSASGHKSKVSPSTTALEVYPARYIDHVAQRVDQAEVLQNLGHAAQWGEQSRQEREWHRHEKGYEERLLHGPDQR